MEAPQQYCLRWKYHHSNLQAMFSQLLERECFCDVTLACGGKTLKAHKVMLSACSTYFDSILSQHEESNGPITVILKDVKYSDIKALVQFMYKGEINVDNSELTSLLKTAEELRIKGLAEVSWRSEKEMQDAVRGGDDESEVEEEEEDEPPQPPAPKRMRCDATWNPATAAAAAVAHQQQLQQQQQQQQHQQQMNKSINHQQQQQLQHSINVKEESKEEDSDEGERDYKWASNMRSRSNSLSSPQQLANAMFMAGQQRHDINKSPLAVAMHRAAMQSNMSGGNAGMVYQQVAARLSNNGPTTYLTVQLGAASGASGGGGGSSGGGDEDQQQQRYAALQQQQQQQQLMYATAGSSNSNADSQSNATPVSTFDASQYPDVMKMNDYLESGGRRPQFWEEPFTKKVMESIKNKELEMKVAAELMGVSYGTLYGRYRDAYGCLKHPYRIRDFWTEAGPAEVIGKLQRKEISMFRAAEMLNVTVTTLANYLTTLKSGGGAASSNLPASSTQATNVEDADIASDELEESMEDDGGPRMEAKYAAQPQDMKFSAQPQFGAARPHDEADDPSMVTDDNDNRMEMLCKMEMREEDGDRPIVAPISPGGVNGAHE